MTPDLRPIIVGVGQVNDRPDDPLKGLDPVALMAEALRKAEADAGAPLLAEADFLGVVKQISFPEIADACAPLSQALSAAPTSAMQTAGPNGDSPIMLLNEAANGIAAGDTCIALVVGAEALRTAAARVAVAEEGRKLDPTREAAHRKRKGYAQSYGLVAPVDVYPLYENALRAHLGQTLKEAQAESGAIWAQLSKVAAKNENAWLRQPVNAEDVITPSERNRPIAFPYTKLQVANSSVNQGAGFIVTSVGEARQRGIAEAKWVYVGNGAAAHEDEHFLMRDGFDRSVSMEVSNGSPGH
jgi:acetyl-CoA C-acetyltransferase